jgi:hypothetical protein
VKPRRARFRFKATLGNWAQSERVMVGELRLRAQIQSLMIDGGIAR